MSNKKDLKKTINYICDDLMAESVAAALYGGKPNPENMETLLKCIMRIQSDFVSRVCHPEPGMKASVYYKDLVKSFNEQVSEIIDQIGNMNWIIIISDDKEILQVAPI